MKTQKTTRIHEFRGLVAVSHTDTKQLYLTPAHAHKLAIELRRFAAAAEKTSTIATRLVEEVKQTPYPVGTAKAYTESTGAARIVWLP